MRFTKAILAVLSAAATQAVFITNADFTGITVGVPFVITYEGAVGPVTVFLGTGDPTNVIQGPAIGSSPGASGSIPWTPRSGGNFALKIVDANDAPGPQNPNFSGFFPVAGPVAGTTTTGVAVSTSSSTILTNPISTTTNPSNMTTMTTTTGTYTATYNGTTSTVPTTVPTSSPTGGVPVQIPNSAAGVASPIAFVMMAVGALLTLN